MKSANGNGTSAKTPFDEGVCERYILGELSEPERQLFETAYFNDDAFFNRFLAAKDELLDLYSRNELDPDKRRRVQQHFGSTSPRRQRLAESGDFVRSVTAIANRDSRSTPLMAEIEPKPPTIFETLKGLFPVPMLAAAAVLLVLIAVGFWILRKPGTPELIADEPAPQPRANMTPSNPEQVVGGLAPDNNTKANENPGTQPTSEPNRPREPEIAVNPYQKVQPATPAPSPARSPDPTIIPPAPVQTPEQRVADVVKPPEPKPEVTGARTETVTLSSASRSVTGRNTASIGTATQSVVIRLMFGGDAYDTYSVRVTTLGGATVWRASNINIGGSARSLAVTLPAASLTRKDYIVILEGRSPGGISETIREYYLHVDRQ
jgi:hypothetical protein